MFNWLIMIKLHFTIAIVLLIAHNINSGKVKVTCPDYSYGILVSSDREVKTIHVRQLTVTKKESEDTKYFCVYWFGSKSKANIQVIDQLKPPKLTD